MFLPVIPRFMKLVCVALPVLLIISSTDAQPGLAAFPYDLSSPNRRVQLPPVLNEVSGLTDIDNGRVACVQDEIGVVFIYDLEEEAIVQELPFDSVGDFEGLTYTDSAMYVLRSDGRLSEYRPFTLQGDKGRVTHTDFQLPSRNNEGLCSDPQTGLLLISAKSKEKGAEGNDRSIYAYNPMTRQYMSEPAYRINMSQLEYEVRKRKLYREATSPKGKPKPFQFRPSSLCIYPPTGNLVVMSAVDFMVCVFNRQGDVVHVQRLNPELFPQAEGITITPDGKLIITSEGAGGAPSLSVFFPEE